MIRVLFSVLAVLAAVVAYVFEMPVLYAAAAVLLLIAFVLLLDGMRRRHRSAKRPYLAPKSSMPPGVDEDLKSLGIMEIKPRSKTPAGSAPAASAPSPAPPASFAPPQVDLVVEDEDVSDEPMPDLAVDHGDHAPLPVAIAHPQTRDDVLVPYLQSLRASLGAKTVGLLRQPGPAPHYHIEALVSARPGTRDQGTFRTDVPLLTPAMASQPITVRPVGSSGGLSPNTLGYYRDPDGIRQAAFAPIAIPDADAAFILVADATDDRLDRARSRTLLIEFARLLGLLLDDAPSSATDAPAVRPRREIIAEEMRQARIDDTPLALALVFLHRPDEFDEAKDEAEEAFEAALKKASTPCRVERFGEMTYGVFYHDAADVDAWAARVQDALEANPTLPAGDLSIGVALLQNRHQTPGDFRADANEALREAYESGACTILE